MENTINDKFAGVKFTNGRYDYIINSFSKRHLLSMKSDMVYIVAILDGSGYCWKKTPEEIKKAFKEGRWQKIN